MLHQCLILGGELKDEAVLKKIHGEHPRVVHFNTRTGGAHVDQIRGTGLRKLMASICCKQCQIERLFEGFYCSIKNIKWFFNKNAGRLILRNFHSRTIGSSNVTSEITNNTLLQEMLLDLPGAVAHFERIHVKTGAWPANGMQHSDWVYFPDDSLVSLSPGRQAMSDATIAVVGRHGCWLPGTLDGAQLQAQVLHGGQVYRLDWGIVQDDPRRFAPWLMRTANASQRLIRQMTQMAFCAHQHTVTQRMASWLLVCLHQSNQASLCIRLIDVPHSVRSSPDAFQAALSALEARAGIRCDPEIPSSPGQEQMPARLWTLDPQQLSGLACSCHRHINEEVSA